MSRWRITSRRARRAAVSVGWRRELAAQVSVAVDGVVDLEDSVPDQRPVGRVVVTMPDFVADTVAHLLAAGCQASTEAAGLDAVDTPGPDERALAEALFAASRVGGYRCPSGRLDLPRAAAR